MLLFRGLPVVCLFACLSGTFVHCAQTVEDMDTISFAYTTPMSPSHRFKIWLTSVNQSYLNSAPEVIHPC